MPSVFMFAAQICGTITAFMLFEINSAEQP